ncbi:hypothetical protein CGI33_21220 [Vibrio parahaemolyticus]|nr:hypothetical protein AVO50_18250 [Vibrio parahaemolyticus]TOJ73712.1 hypothetical protein CGI33_21220 [Vibrio parahaemolyticus]
MQVGGEFHWLKVWQGQVNRGFRSCFTFAALCFVFSKAAWSLKVCISWLSKFRLKHNGFYGS